MLRIMNKRKCSIRRKVQAQSAKSLLSRSNCHFLVPDKDEQRRYRNTASNMLIFQRHEIFARHYTLSYPLFVTFSDCCVEGVFIRRPAVIIEQQHRRRAVLNHNS
jgi:hypothetical protein